MMMDGLRKLGMVDVDELGREFRKQELDEALVDFIVKDSQPFTVVSDPGFRALVAKLDPTCTLPSRQTVKVMVERREVEEKEKAKAALQNVDSVSLTADMWTSINMDAYLAVTCHAIHADLRVFANPVDRTKALLKCHVTSTDKSVRSVSLTEDGATKANWITVTGPLPSGDGSVILILTAEVPLIHTNIYGCVVQTEDRTIAVMWAPIELLTPPGGKTRHNPGPQQLCPEMIRQIKLREVEKRTEPLIPLTCSAWIWAPFEQVTEFDDGVVISHCDSGTQQEHFKPVLESHNLPGTCRPACYDVFDALKEISKFINHTRNVQRRRGCITSDERLESAFDNWAVNGEGFIQFDAGAQKWKALSPSAEMIKDSWNNREAQNDFFGHFINEECPEMIHQIKLREAEKRTDLRVFANPVDRTKALLKCHVTSTDKSVRSVSLTEDGAPKANWITVTGPLPSGDGSVILILTAEVPLIHTNIYGCVVQTEDRNITVMWGENFTFTYCCMIVIES
ncbi:hypothetical protein D4764_0116830 [Takifugu flavidus]|uniref:MHC class I-like antigen recognition-like domain-containing protein n=1 Tax=Takifugu flavidus TaxID=433684 RepID=A0A5C6MGP8_9TELE|nr:hypothetical protein D4764_0116830 [Takifugu flavidus]